MFSFIVPAHNEEASIAATVQGIAAAAAQAAATHEIIVVADACTDRTAELAAAAGAGVVVVACRHIAATRNAGARAATGEVFVFVDADTLIGTDVVRGVGRVMAGGAVGGGAAVRFDEPTPRWVKWVLPVSIWLARRMKFTGGCFLFASRAAFEAVGGFDEMLFAAEELRLCKRLRAQGDFVILREAVLTSGRKLRTYSGWELIGAALRIAAAGQAGVRDRSRLAIWYAPRRVDVSGPRGGQFLHEHGPSS
jgi:cellulose synthase/poly-beta-1,6-N-acetylglucosamine synthase-like glycosyltransferase